MFITVHGTSLEVLSPEQLPAVLAQLAEQSTPAGDRPPQVPNPAPLAFARTA